ncbi:MAG: hypothetical protein M3436_15595 [Pseudomonadota bacterium]|nr:hypothetical protein [Pseudomonadota bacterium]
MHILQANFAYDGTLADPDALLDRYRTLTGWSEALVDEHTVAIGRANGLHPALSLRLAAELNPPFRTSVYRRMYAVRDRRCETVRQRGRLQRFSFLVSVLYAPRCATSPVLPA